MRIFAKLFLVSLATLLAPVIASATTDCVFNNVGTTMTLTADCTTDSTIFVPDGWTLDGNGKTITAVDPPSGHFLGAVIKNAGTVAHVINLTVTTSNLANACDGGNDRLRGIMFEGASGTITLNTVFNVNQGASGCQEGNAIEVRNAPFDGSHLNLQGVEIAHNRLSSWQKTGIVCNGDVTCNVHHNTIGGSATQANLAANSVQFGFGALGSIENNQIAGNSWCCVDAAATAVLIFDAGDGVVVRHNNIMDGNADVGIYFGANNGVVDNNRVFETGPDGYYDIGIGNYGPSSGPGTGSGNTVTNNKVRAFETPYDAVSGGKNKVIPSPKD